MKKIVSIVAALAMATAMFADPEAVSSIAKFDGNASVTWGVNLDNNKTGFENALDGGLRVVLMNGGTKATSSDATVWGEIEIKARTLGYQAGVNGTIGSAGWDGDNDGKFTVEKAVLHIGPAWVGILAGNTQVGDITPVLAVKSSNSWEDNAGYKVNAVGVDASQGITIGFQADGIVKVEADIRSNKNADGSKYSDAYATAIQADLLAVPNLTFSVGVAHNLTVGHKNWETGLNDDALFAKAAYELSINDTFYVKPQAGVSLETPEVAGVAKDSKKLIAMGAVLFGWNKNENQGWNGIWGSQGPYTSNNRSNGASVAIFVENQSYSAGEKNETVVTGAKLIAGVWDAATLVPNLTFGANFEVENLIASAKSTTDGKSDFEDAAKALDMSEAELCRYSSGLYATKTLTFEAKYDIAVGEGKVTPKAGFAMADKLVKSEPVEKDVIGFGAKKEYKFDFTRVNLGVDLTGFVPYTDFSVVYENTDLDTTKGTLDLTCKIHF